MAIKSKIGQGFLASGSTRFKVLLIILLLLVVSVIVTLNLFFYQTHESEMAFQINVQQTIIAKSIALSIDSTMAHLKEEVISLSGLLSERGLHKKGLIVMDYSLVLTKPFTLKSTLKHELVHLVLGRHLGRQIPKWLNEGVAQLIADNPAEIILSRNTSVLSGAVLSDRLIPLADLKSSFPTARRGMVLAYEESRSFVRYLDEEFGRDGLLEILRAVKNGKSHTDAISSVTGSGIDELESKWKQQLRLKVTWLSYFSNHFYELLFALAALLTFFAFIRVIYRIRTYRDDDDEDADGLRG